MLCIPYRPERSQFQDLIVIVREVYATYLHQSIISSCTKSESAGISTHRGVVEMMSFTLSNALMSDCRRDHACSPCVVVCFGVLSTWPDPGHTDKGKLQFPRSDTVQEHPSASPVSGLLRSCLHEG